MCVCVHRKEVCLHMPKMMKRGRKIDYVELFNRWGLRSQTDARMKTTLNSSYCMIVIMYMNYAHICISVGTTASILVEED